MNVLVIPEDFRYDQYILRPIVGALLKDVGKPNARINILMDPLLGGVSKALSLRVLQDEVLPRYPMVHLFLLLVDRDGEPGRRAQLLNLEQQICFFLGERRCFMGEAAIEEIEVWALAGDPSPGAPWVEIRGERHPKENYFEPLARDRGLEDEPGEGRDTLGKGAAASLRRVIQLCPEVGHLRDRIETFVSEGECIHGPYEA